MRRVGIFLLAVIALVAMAGPVSAQPKVTITGFVDNLTTWNHNVSNVDNNLARSKDQEWYSRTRVRPDITAEVGTTKFVLGLELDETWGQTGNAGAIGSCGGTAANVAPFGQCSGPQRLGATAGWQLNTDTQGALEIKWAYTEFDLPIMPVPTRIRVGAQPWEAHYKLAVLANGDFAGFHMTNQWTPMIKTNFTFAQIEESSSGPTDAFVRGDDYAIVASVEITPFKGLDLRPIFSYANIIGVTSAATRQGRGGVSNAAAFFPTCPGTTGPGTGNCVGGGGVNSASAIENRYTVGIDARWRFGPFSLDPTAFYQFGNREQICGTAMCNLARDAWFVDFRGGWQAGPLLVEGAVIYTSGNKATDRIDLGQSRLKFYEPISTDTSFFGGGWGSMFALGIDYFNILHNSIGGLNPGVAIGYDKYGLVRVGGRASYALTPAFTLITYANANWTAQSVDTHTTSILVASGLTPCAAANFGGAASATCAAAIARGGDAQYLGAEFNLGFQWRFVPNVALDVMGTYMWAGNGLSALFAANANTGVVSSASGPRDAQLVTARIRYSW